MENHCESSYKREKGAGGKRTCDRGASTKSHITPEPDLFPPLLSLVIPVFFPIHIVTYIHDTTSCDDGLDGLSKLMTPYAKCSDKLRANGELPVGNGV